MGFFGSYLVARCPQPLARHPLLARYRAEPVHVWRDGDWQMIQTFHEGMMPVADVVSATAAPALVAYVVDSDFAVVEADSPAHRTWRAILKPAMAESYGAPLDGFGPVENVIDGARAWAVEAGRDTDERVLREALATDELFAENAVHDLVAALGFRLDEGERLE